jgi:hypothetical protein
VPSMAIYIVHLSCSGLTWVYVLWYGERSPEIKQIICILYGNFTLRCTIWWWLL